MIIIARMPKHSLEFLQVINTARKCDWSGVTLVRPISTCSPSLGPGISLRLPSGAGLDIFVADRLVIETIDGLDGYWVGGNMNPVF